MEDRLPCSPNAGGAVSSQASSATACLFRQEVVKLCGHDDDVPLRIPRIAASTLYTIARFGLDGRCYECDRIPAPRGS